MTHLGKLCVTWIDTEESARRADAIPAAPALPAASALLYLGTNHTPGEGPLSTHLGKLWVAWIDDEEVSPLQAATAAFLDV